MIISDLITEMIREVGGEVDDTELETEFLGYVKAALRRFPRFCRNRMLLSQKTATLASGAQTVALPSGVISILQAFYTDTDGNRIEIDRSKLKKFNEQYNSSVTGHPFYFIVRGNTVEFDRKADQAYTITFECTIEIDDVASDDTWAYSSDRAEIMKDGAKSYYYGSVEDDNQETKKLTLFNAGLKKLEAEYVREETADHVEEAS